MMHLRLSLFAAAIVLMGQPIWAQQLQTGNTGTGTTNTGTGTTGGTTTGGGTATGGGAVDADQAFSQIERGSTVGATASTGAGFNDLGGAASGIGSAGGFGGLGGFGGGGGGFGGFGGLGGLFGNAAASTSSRPVIRTRLRSAIEVTPRTSTQIQRSATQRMVTLPSQSRISGVNIRVQDGNAILEGVVGTEKERRMSELLLRLEPGVKSVENRISLSPSFE
ncbi:BON domain-containing protein [Novipirellula rosea]|tara:strand:+ start:5812 stop:6477 length:666 start_codon:yes stop_codon:yes gene_type:complete